MSEQPERVFFTDRDLGKRFPEILREAGINVEGHIDHFADDTKDEEWLSEIGKRGWYAITRDRRIRYKANEIEAVKKFGVGLFVLIGKVPFSELAYNFISTLSKIERLIDRNPRPFIAKVYLPDQKSRKARIPKPGRVIIWVSFKDSG